MGIERGLKAERLLNRFGLDRDIFSLFVNCGNG
jgi:hypothetical protein